MPLMQRCRRVGMLVVAEGYIKAYYDDGQGLWYNQVPPDDETLTDWDLYGVRAKEAFHLWHGGEVLVGADLDWISGSANFLSRRGIYTSFDRMTWTMFSPYGALSQIIGDKDGWHVIPSAGLRAYTHSQFDSELAPQAGIVAGYGPFEVHGNYARGVSYPGLNVAVFSSNVIPSLGDSWKKLNPETVDHFEAGASMSYEKIVRIDATYFSDYGHDRYVMYPVTGRPEGFRNYESFQIQGVETSLTVNPIEQLSLFTGMTYLDHNPKDLPYAPDWTLSFGGNWLFLEHFKLSADAQYVDEMAVLSQARRQGTYNTDMVDSFWLVNAKLAFLYSLEKFGLEGELFVAGQNLTDSDYEYRPDYPMPGINFTVGASVAF